MNELELLTLIADGETLALEFKGESKKQLSDRELVLVCVCMTNTTAGSLLIGVEKDGTISGAKPRHGTYTDPSKLSALIRNSTMPPIDVVVIGTPHLQRFNIGGASTQVSKHYKPYRRHLPAAHHG